MNGEHPAEDQGTLLAAERLSDSLTVGGTVAIQVEAVEDREQAEAEDEKSGYGGSQAEAAQAVDHDSSQRLS